MSDNLDDLNDIEPSKTPPTLDFPSDDIYAVASLRAIIDEHYDKFSGQNLPWSTEGLASYILDAGYVPATATAVDSDETTWLDPPWLCVGGDNCGDRFATLGDAHAPHSAAYRPIVRCAHCGTPIHFYESPTGSWWSHVVHPSDEHDAEPRIDREKAFRIMNAILDENEHPARPEAGAN